MTFLPPLYNVHIHSHSHTYSYIDKICSIYWLGNCRRMCVFVFFFLFCICSVYLFIIFFHLFVVRTFNLLYIAFDLDFTVSYKSIEKQINLLKKRHKFALCKRNGKSFQKKKKNPYLWQNKVSKSVPLIHSTIYENNFRSKSLRTWF